MKEQYKIKKKGFIKKLFVKLCRVLGYEIIDQSNFFVPTQKKELNENLSSQGKKSIIIPAKYTDRVPVMAKTIFTFNS